MQQLSRAPTELSGLMRHLLQDGLLDGLTARTVLQQTEVQNCSLVTYLVRNQIISSTAILKCCAQNYGLTIFELNLEHVHHLNEFSLSPDLIRAYQAIPLGKIENELRLGISDPTNHAALAVFSFHTGLRIRPVLVDEIKLNELITHYCTTDAVNKQVQVALQTETPLEEHEDEPIIKLTDTLLNDAARNQASDLHLEPYEHHYRVRYRQDGFLHEITHIPNYLAPKIIARLKVLAELNIAERRLPQDGRFTFILHNSRTLDIRMSSCPTLFGEKIVLRLLDKTQLNLDINELGLLACQKKVLIHMLSMPQGFILVTGPTGSGKTATLYSALDYLNNTEKNISTVEDPIEIQLSGINQINIHPKIGLNFSTILKSLLRQDPDILMVGEIRDYETAEIAISAAQTGHLVLSTLHTNSAAEAITRLQSMHIAPYKLCSALTVIIAQRLLRKLCPHCKQPDEKIKSTHIIYQAVGCTQCRFGYHGRTGVFELLPLTPQLIELILQNASTQEIVVLAKNEGFISLWESGLELINNGITSFSELHRVVKE